MKKSEVKKSMIVVPNPPDHDSDGICFTGFPYPGDGYKFKKRSEGYGLIRCPACGRENYAANVCTGKCYICGFDIKSLLKKKRKK